MTQQHTPRALRFDQHDEATLAALMTAPPPSPPMVERPEPEASEILRAFIHPKRGPIELTMGDLVRICAPKSRAVRGLVCAGLLSVEDFKGERIYQLTPAGLENARRAA